MLTQFATVGSNGTIKAIGPDPVELALDRSWPDVIVELIQPHHVGDDIELDARNHSEVMARN